MNRYRVVGCALLLAFAFVVVAWTAANATTGGTVSWYWHRGTLHGYTVCRVTSARTCSLVWRTVWFASDGRVFA